MPTAIPFTSLHSISKARSGSDTRANQEWAGAVVCVQLDDGKICHWSNLSSHHSRTQSIISLAVFSPCKFPAADEPPHPSETLSAQPWRTASTSRFVSPNKSIKKRRFRLAKEGACSLMRRLVLFSFFLSVMMTYPVISPVLDVIRMRCAPSLDPIAMDHHPCITPKE